MHCPRCVQPVAPDAPRCPSCGYDVTVAGPATPHVPADHVAEGEQAAAPPHGGPVTTATPWDSTGLIAPVTDENAALIPGFSQAPSQPTGLLKQPRRDWWLLAGVALTAFAVLAVIAVVVASRIGHRGTVAQASPIETRPLHPTSAMSPSATASKTTSGSGSGSRRPAHRQRGLAQASRIDALLTRSGHVRHGIGGAISAISGCTDIGAAVITLRRAAEVRTRILIALASTPVSALPHGSAAVADLRRAMRASANADRHYAAWGKAVAGCHGHAPHDAALAAALQSDSAATVAKQRFADEWNPIAARYGLARQNANTI